MKKLFVLTLCLMCLFITANAKSGDINGAVYETDITATINGVSVPSYNIGGRTVVIVEEITTQHYYNDKLRTLIIGSLAPDALVEGSRKVTSAKVGTKIANTYETDIVTYVYDKKIPCYSLNGQMAVAIEDLGGDNTFNDLGGRYVWNATERSISLEFMYAGPITIADIMHEKHVNLRVAENNVGEFISEPIMHASMYGITISDTSSPSPITVDGRIIGYTFCPIRSGFAIDEYGNVSLDFLTGVSIHCFFEDVVAEILKDVEPVMPTREDWLEHYEMQMMSVLDSIETEEYTFLYMSQPNTHGASQFLRRVAADGSVICYDDNFKSVSLYGQKYFSNVKIDRENEKVTFHYDKDYIIDLKTGEIQ